MFGKKKQGVYVDTVLPKKDEPEVKHNRFQIEVSEDLDGDGWHWRLYEWDRNIFNAGYDYKYLTGGLSGTKEIATKEAQKEVLKQKVRDEKRKNRFIIEVPNEQ